MKALIKIGNFFFHNRNWLFPFFYAVLFIPTIKISENYSLVLVIGLIIAIFGQVVRMLTIGFVYIAKSGVKNRINADKLHVEGLFKHSRNPLYVGNVSLMLGMSILSNSVMAVVILFPLFVFIYYTIIFAEEDYLTGKFGDEYLNYKKSVNRWMFNFTGISDTLQNSAFKWKRALRVEYSVLFLWILPAVILIFIQYNSVLGVGFYNQYLTVFIIIFISLLILYFLIRFLKKTKRLED